MSQKVFSLGYGKSSSCPLLDSGKTEHIFIHVFIHSLAQQILAGTSCVPSSENSGVSKTLLSRALILLSGERGACVQVPGPWCGFCPRSLSAPPGLTPGPGAARYFFGLSAVDSVSWLCGGPGLQLKGGGAGRAVLNWKPGVGAVTVFS